MVTLVGTQMDFADALFELCSLDYDAIEAYHTAISGLQNEAYKNKLLDFVRDHERHVELLMDLLKNHYEKTPQGPSPKQLLTQGKLILANLMGDEAILRAMLTNEIDTNTAYERVFNHEDKWEDAKDLLRKSFEDEKRHKQWLQLTLHGLEGG